MWRLLIVQNAYDHTLCLWLLISRCINHLALKTSDCGYADTTLLARSFYKPSAPVSHTDNGHSKITKTKTVAATTIVNATTTIKTTKTTTGNWQRLPTVVSSNSRYSSTENTDHKGCPRQSYKRNGTMTAVSTIRTVVKVPSWLNEYSIVESDLPSVWPASSNTNTDPNWPIRNR